MVPKVQIARYEGHGYHSLSDMVLCETSARRELGSEETDHVAFCLVPAELLNPSKMSVHFLQLFLCCLLCLFTPSVETSLNVIGGIAR